MIYDFFAASNSKDGFKSYFSDIFSEEKLTRLFIIYGGSGSGKSTLMKNAAAYFSESGKNVDVFHCSADPDSYDGLLIDGRVGIVDGTSPHFVFPVYPGAFETVINTGECWDIDILSSHRQEIKDLIVNKSKFFIRAYRFLKAAGEIENERLSILKPSVEHGKMYSAAARAVNADIKCGNMSTEETRIAKAITARGYVNLDGLERLCEKKIFIDDALGLGHLYLQSIKTTASGKNQRSITSYDPIMSDRMDALVFPDAGTGYFCKNRKECKTEPYKWINMRRFISNAVISSNKSRLKFSASCRDALIDGAVRNFSEANKLHELVEEYYISAMDYNKCDTLTFKVIREAEKSLNA